MSSDSILKPKRIHVFVNGNPTERIFFIHPKCRVSWSSIMNFIGDLLKPQQGPIKVLRRTDGRPVKTYEDLDDNGKYIACGKESIIQLPEGYRTESEMEFNKGMRETPNSEVTNFIVEEKNYNDDMNDLTLYVFMNGLKMKPFEINLLKTDLEHWETVLSTISKQMNAPVTDIYTIFGEKLMDPTEIQHRGFYVALPEGSKFDDVSYLSVFSLKKQRKVRFKQTTHQVVKNKNKFIDKKDGDEDGELVKTIDKFESLKNCKDENLMCNCQVINVNNPTPDTPCIHVTIVQRPFSASRHTPGVPSTVCAIKPSAKLIFEMLSDKEFKLTNQLCKTTQTNAIFCEAIPKGKCVIEVASKKFHIIPDEDTIVLPCGTYFSPHRSMKKPCIFPLGNDSFSLENIANKIVGIVVDVPEYSRALSEFEQSLNELEDVNREQKNASDILVEKKIQCSDQKT